MSFIIGKKCISTCDTACVDVCPVDCIHGPFKADESGAETKSSGFDAKNKMLYINPEECIDCGACEPECPVDAIFSQQDVPSDWNRFIRLNYEFFGQEYND